MIGMVRSMDGKVYVSPMGQFIGSDGGPELPE